MSAARWLIVARGWGKGGAEERDETMPTRGPIGGFRARHAVVTAALLLAGCGQGAPAPKPTPTPAASDGKRGPAAPNSPDARAAMATVQRYFRAIEARDYAAAYAMWTEGGRSAAPSLAAFEASFAPYSEYEPAVGRPTAVTVRDGTQYVLVSASTFVKRRGSGATAERDGFVMLRRSVDPRDPDPAKRDWHIWATDIRVRH